MLLGIFLILGYINTTGAITIGGDVVLSRGAANRLDLASGDSFNLVSGSLQVASIPVITSGRLIRAADGSVTEPSFSFHSDQDTGMYSGGANILRFVTAGSNRMSILADGNVGIGTTTPNAALSFGTGVANNKIYLYDGTSDKYGFGIASSELMIYSGAAGASTGGITFGKYDGTTYTEAVRIRNDGRVGIGTSSPDSLFSVGSGSLFRVDATGDLTRIKNLAYTWPTAHTANGYLKNNGTGGLSWAEVNAVQATGTPYGDANGGQVSFWSGSDTITGDDNLYWDNVNKFLGIGTTTPGAPLDIAGTGGSGSLIKNSSGDITIEPAANLIISQGNVGIGTDNPLAKLHVKGNGILLKNEANSTVDFTLDSGSTTTQRSVISFKDRGSDVFVLEKTATNAFQLYDYAGTGVSRFLVEAGSNSGIAMRTKGSGNFSFINDTTTLATITSTGRMGIGNASPSTNLDVNGHIFLGNGGSFSNAAGWNTVLDQYGSSHARNTLRTSSISLDLTVHNSGWASAPTGAHILTSTNHPLSFGTNNSSRMTILGNGNVGIGTTSPSRTLHVNGAMRLSSASTPSSPATGDIYNAGSHLYYHNGTDWVQLSNNRTKNIVLYERNNLSHSINYANGADYIRESSGGTISTVTITIEKTSDIYIEYGVTFVNSNTYGAHANLQRNGTTIKTLVKLL
jgi:hypothetical protein